MKGCCFPMNPDRVCKGSFKLIKSPFKCFEQVKRESRRAPLIVCFGEMLIEIVPTRIGVSLEDAVAYKKAPAGAPANVAIGVSRLGGSVAFIGKVGEDEFGHMLADILKQNGVDSSGMRFDALTRTSLAFVSFERDAKPEFLYYRNPSADMLLRPEEVDMNLINRASIFHYGSMSLTQEPCRSAHLAAMDFAKRTGTILSYDPKLRLSLWSSAEAARKGIMSIWNYADIIKLSLEETQFLIQGDDPYNDNVIISKLFHRNLKLLLVTEGAEGCRYYTQNFKGWVSGFEVEVVDTTGAGESFVSGMLCIMAAHKDIYKDEKRLREALAFANACGAITVSRRGAIPALPTKDVVLKALYSISTSQS